MLGSNFKYNTSTQDTRQILISVPNMKVGCVLDKYYNVDRYIQTRDQMKCQTMVQSEILQLTTQVTSDCPTDIFPSESYVDFSSYV